MSLKRKLSISDDEVVVIPNPVEGPHEICEVQQIVGDIKFIDEQAFVDFTIACQGELYGVHKIILIRGSEFFKTAVNDASRFKEAVNNVMNLDEEDSILVEIMLRHLYSHAYLKGHPSPPDVTLQLHAQMYGMADRFGIDDLKILVQERFEILLQKNYAKDDFAAVIREVYLSTPDSDRGLRDLVVKQSANRFAEVGAKPEFFRMMAETGTFGVDLVKSGYCQTMHKFSCPACWKSFDATLNHTYIERLNSCPHCYRQLYFTMSANK